MPQFAAYLVHVIVIYAPPASRGVIYDHNMFMVKATAEIVSYDHNIFIVQ
jgi:hypothetical protein